MSLKRGKMSKAEETFILHNVHDLSIEQIAKALDRTIAPIEKFIKSKNLKNTAVINDKEYEKNLLMKRLRDRNYYPELKQMLTANELLRFEEDWVEVILQFHDNVVYTEEIMIKQWILLQILADRSMKSRKDAMKESDNLHAQIDAEMAVDEQDRNTTLLNGLNQQLGYAREGMIAFTREHSQILDKIKDIERSLKATRDTRVKIVEDSNTTFNGYLRLLEDEQNRRNAGEDAEIKRLAKDAAKDRLAKWHMYEDGRVDQPLLTSETVLDEFDKPPDEDMADD